MGQSRNVARIICISMLLYGCAVNPADMQAGDPFGMGAAIGRCISVKPEDRVLPEWFAMFGPGLACR